MFFRPTACDSVYYGILENLPQGEFQDRPRRLSLVRMAVGI